MFGDESNPGTLFVIIMVTLIIAGGFVCGRKDPETGRIRVLFVGDMIRVSPYPILLAEPSIDVRFAWPVGSDLTQMSLPLAMKFYRQYTPRSYSIFAQNDVIIIDNPDASIFEPKYFFWFNDAVLQNGSGFFMVGGNAAFGGHPGTNWGETPVQDILPVWCVDFGWKQIGRVVITDDDHEFVASLPFERRWEWMEAVGGNEVIAREGTRIIAESRSIGAQAGNFGTWHESGGWVNPFWVTWDPGEGRAFIQSTDWTPGGGTVLMRWPYYADYVINLMTYLSMNPVPADLDLMHELRGMFQEFRSLKNYVFSIMDFAERLGANMMPVLEVLTEIDAEYQQSVEAYIDQDYPRAGEMIKSSIEGLSDASALAFRLKDQVMLWIYFIEWLIVTGTLSIAGFVIWTLMIRRRLYEEVESTRFTGR